MKSLEALCGCEKSRILRQIWRNCRTFVQDSLTNHWTRHTDWFISVHRYQQPYHSPEVSTRTVTRNSLVLNLDWWRQWCGTRCTTFLEGICGWKIPFFSQTVYSVVQREKELRRAKLEPVSLCPNLNLMVEYSFVQLQHWCLHSCAHDIWTESAYMHIVNVANNPKETAIVLLAACCQFLQVVEQLLAIADFLLLGKPNKHLPRRSDAASCTLSAIPSSYVMHTRVSISMLELCTPDDLKVPFLANDTNDKESV